MTTFRTLQYNAVPKNPANTVGKQLRSVPASVTVVAATNENGDVWILSGPHTLDQKIDAILGATPAFTAATDNDFGFYKKKADGTFVAIDKDILVDGADLSSALTHRDLLTLNASLDRTKTIGGLLGLNSEQEPTGGVYLALTMNTASSATTATAHLIVEVEEATCA